MNERTRHTHILIIAARWLLKLAAVAAVLAAALLSSGAPATATTAAPAAASLQLIAEPQAGIAPFLQRIDGARSSVDLTMYELFDRRIEQALAADAKRGVDVRVLLNSGYYRTPDTKNAQAYSYLAAHGVHVRYSPTYFALTHQKTLTVDGRESVIMTLNFDGLYASTRDFAILDNQPADVQAITEAFDADYSARRIVASSGTGDLVWSPGNGAETAVLKLLGSATKSIDLEDEEMDYPAATTALCQAARRGVQVRVVMTSEASWDTAFAELRGCGASIHLYHGQAYYIHAKMLLVDGREALVSSQNLSIGSLQYNRELGITITNPALLSALTADFGSDYAGA